MNENKSNTVMLIIVLILVSINTLCSIVIAALTIKNSFNWNNLDNKILESSSVNVNSNQNDAPDTNIKENQNSTIDNTDNSTNESEHVDTSSAKVSSVEQPLGMNEWGLAGKYILGNYVDVPVRITKVTRGNNVEAGIKKWFDNQNVYKYKEPENGLEWAIVNYQVDFSNVNTNDFVTKEINSEIKGIDSIGVKYNNRSYIVSTTYTSDRDAVKNSGTYEAQFITQLPTGCTDYLIGMGSSYEGAGSISYFKVE